MLSGIDTFIVEIKKTQWEIGMRELNQEQVRALADAADLKVPEEEMGRLTVRLNGMFELLHKLDSLPLDDAEIIPTLLTQRED